MAEALAADPQIAPPAQAPAADPTPSDQGQQPSGQPQRKYASKFKGETDADYIKQLETGYGELEKRLGQAPQTTPQPRDDGAPQISKAGPDDNSDIPTLLTRAGLKPDDLANQWRESGDLTPEQYAAIRKARPSLTKADIRFIAEGMHAKDEVRRAEVARAVGDAVSLVGSRTDFDTLLSEAAAFVPEDEIDAVNTMLRNPKTVKTATRLLMAMRTEHIGAGGSRPIVGGGTAKPGAPASSHEEFDQLMNRAISGDQAALARVNATTPEMMHQWKR